MIFCKKILFVIGAFCGLFNNDLAVARLQDNPQKYHESTADEDILHLQNLPTAASGVTSNIRKQFRFYTLKKDSLRLKDEFKTTDRFGKYYIPALRSQKIETSSPFDLYYHNFAYDRDIGSEKKLQYSSSFFAIQDLNSPLMTLLEIPRSRNRYGFPSIEAVGSQIIAFTSMRMGFPSPMDIILAVTADNAVIIWSRKYLSSDKKWKLISASVIGYGNETEIECFLSERGTLMTIVQTPQQNPTGLIMNPKSAEGSIWGQQEIPADLFLKNFQELSKKAADEEANRKFIGPNWKNLESIFLDPMVKAIRTPNGNIKIELKNGDLLFLTPIENNSERYRISQFYMTQTIGINCPGRIYTAADRKAISYYEVLNGGTSIAFKLADYNDRYPNYEFDCR